MDFPDELRQALEELAASGQVEVLESGELLAELSGLRFDVKRQGHRTILHLWSEERNLVRRVLRIAEREAGRLLLEVERFGRRPGRLEFVAPGRARPGARLTREKFRARFRQLLLHTFPDEELESLSSAVDLEHSFSGSYTRGVMRRGQRAWAVMGVSPGEDSATVDAMLTYGLLWLDWQREHRQRAAVAGLRLFFPEGAWRLTAHRLQALASGTRVELYEMEASSGRGRMLDPRDIGNLATWLTPRREVEQTLHAASDLVARIRALAPEAIDAMVPPGTREVALRFRGLEFARWRNGAVIFGLGDTRRPLDSRGWKALEKMVRELARRRSPDADDPHHPLYRGQAERWLETMVLADPTRLDAQLDPRCVYSQVPAFSAGDRGVMDLLGVTRDGRLTVIELKVSEDAQLVLQAVDYWLRVTWHHQQGDFPRYGYFGGFGLQDRPPRLCLAAPGFRFHPATELILRYLNEEIEVVRIGLNETWRKGLHVVFRQERH